MITNGSTEIAAVYLGSTRIDAIYKGSDVILSGAVRYTVSTDLTNITSDAPSSVVDGSALIVTLTPKTEHIIDNSSVVVTMGGVDITSTAYSNGVVTIAEVTGNVSITGHTIFDAVVEWLQGDSTAYINTGINVSQNIRIDADITILSDWSGGGSILGGRSNSTSRMLTVQYYRDAVGSGSNIWRWSYGNNQREATHDKTVGTFNLSNVSAANIMVVSGDHSFTLTANAQTFSNSYPIYLFVMNNGGSLASMGNSKYLRFLSCKMYNGSTLVRDYIPVRKNGVGYLYDKVSGNFFGNANSSGAFTYGDDKNS